MTLSEAMQPQRFLRSPIIIWDFESEGQKLSIVEDSLEKAIQGFKQMYGDRKYQLLERREVDADGRPF